MKLQATIPFMGFYESVHSSAIETAVEQEALHRIADENQVEPDELDAVQLEIVSNIIASVDYQPIRGEYARKYVDWFKEEHDMPSMEYTRIESPREYNFETDRIHVTVELEDLKQFGKGVSFISFAQFVYDRLQPSSGFIPNYSNDIGDWPSVITKWDHNQIGLLFEFVHDQDTEHCAVELVNEFESVQNAIY